MIKISKENINKIFINQRKNFKDVISPKWNVEDQVRKHFSKIDYVQIHLQELRKVILLDKRMKILDLGCGYGYMVGLLRKLGFQAFGCDSDKESIVIAKRVLKDNKLDPKVVCINKRKLPYKDESFDLIYLSYVLVYVDDLSSFFKEIKRILRKNGLVYLVTPNYQCCYDTNYGFFLIPWLPRKLNMLYLRLRGRNPDFFKSLSLTTKRNLESIFKKNDFSFDNVGIKEWERVLNSGDFFGRSGALISFVTFVRKLRAESILFLLARMGFYTPLVYILKK